MFILYDKTLEFCRLTKTYIVVYTLFKYRQKEI